MANTCALRFPCRNSTRYLFSVSFFLAIFIILAFIDYESIYKGTNSEPVSRYKQSQLQRKVPERYDGGQREKSWQVINCVNSTSFFQLQCNFYSSEKKNLFKNPNSLTLCKFVQVNSRGSTVSQICLQFTETRGVISMSGYTDYILYVLSF